DSQLPVILLAMSAVLTAIYNRVINVEKFTASFWLLIAATATGLVSVAADSLAFVRVMTRIFGTVATSGGWENWVLLLNHFAATALLGSVMLTMVFGHWYLVVPRLSIDPLKRLTKVLMGAIAIRVVTIIASLAVLQFEQSIPLAVVLRELTIQ